MDKQVNWCEHFDRRVKVVPLDMALCSGHPAIRSMVHPGKLLTRVSLILLPQQHLTETVGEDGVGVAPSLHYGRPDFV